MVTNNSIMYPSVYHGLKLAGTLISSFLAYTLSDIFLELEQYVYFPSVYYAGQFKGGSLFMFN
jgi:hypothetical protein